MHESGLAAAIVAGVRDLDLQGKLIRVFLSGGHAHGEGSRAALAAHIQARMSGAVTAVEVVETPAARLCSGCAAAYLESDEDARCPHCGGAPLPAVWSEPEIAVEVVDPPHEGGR